MHLDGGTPLILDAIAQLMPIVFETFLWQVISEAINAFGDVSQALLGKVLQKMNTLCDRHLLFSY